ncbi:hypothetical protein Taro_012008 [Colocasia esculenta]|uniref:Uncharacterized protein n=1 Tax=Colocasia esculenta TaxID=4460 RepID=A0A843U7V8_COLES|nr:hypothetical protein [Colocasia esculenta]
MSLIISVTSPIFRILVDRVFSACGGQREANVACVPCVCVFLGLTGPAFWACSTLDSSACHRDRKVYRVLNATEVAIAFIWPPWCVERLHAVVMADRRDWGGGGDDPEESTQQMIERIWESLTDIRMRMDRQAPVPPVIEEAVPVAPVPAQPRVELFYTVG